MAEKGPTNQVLEFYTIQGTNQVVRAGDCVLLEHWKADSTTLTTMARVEELDSDHNGNVTLKVRQYYRPEDVLHGKSNIFGSKEVFLSDHYSKQSARTVRQKLNIHSLENYEKLVVVDDDDYYCRFEYHVKSASFRPEYAEVYCKCEMPYNPDIRMVTCVECGERYHLQCIGMTVEQGTTHEQENQLNHYLCGDCLQINEAVVVVGGDDSPSTSKDQGVATTQNATSAHIVDPSLPLTSLHLSLADGTNVVGNFNDHHTVGDIRSFLHSLGIMDYKLQTVLSP